MNYGMTLIALALVSFVSVATTVAGTIVAPGSAVDTPGNSQGPSPFRYGTDDGVGGSRAQQLFDQSLFSEVSEPQLITEISFRPTADSTEFFGTTINFSNVFISLSTTERSEKGLNPLSSTFAENIGNDMTIVYTGALSLTTALTGPVGGPFDFDYSIVLQTPFAYDPTQGNLLLDVMIPTGSTVGGKQSFGFVAFDSVNTPCDGIYSVSDLGNGAATTGAFSTAGAITSFTMTADPSLVAPEPSGLLTAWVGIVGWFSFVRRRRIAAPAH